MNSRSEVPSKPKAIPVIVDHPARDPKFSFQSYVEALQACVIGGATPQFTVGLYGPWGSGKSTILDALQTSLEKESNNRINDARQFIEKTPPRRSGTSAESTRIPEEIIVPVRFEAWRHERTGALFPTLLSLVSEEVDEVNSRLFGKRGSEWYQRIGSLLKNVQHVAIAGIEIGLRGHEETRGAGDLSATVDGYTSAYRALQSFADHEKLRIVVLIDDLDRCSPSSVVDIIEAIRLFMDLPGFVFVLAVDYEVVAEAIHERYPHVDPHRFIEKIVQVPFRIPVMQPAGQSVVRQLLPNWDQIQSRWFSDFEDTTFLDDIITICLRNNPRQSKRLLNSYMIARHINWIEFLPMKGGVSMQRLLITSLTFQLCWPGMFTRFVKELLLEVRRGCPPGMTLREGAAYEVCERELADRDEDFSRFLAEFLTEDLKVHDVHRAVALVEDVGVGALERKAGEHPVLGPGPQPER